MIPSNSRKSSSRRSSILKPQKPRQPLQNVNFNSSSNENSPSTAKLKRRVSFAEKKHVKEFCNSLEQGTVWDNTYEEHDLSNIKIPCTSNEEEIAIATVSKGTIDSNELNTECINISTKTDANISHGSNILQNDIQLFTADDIAQENQSKRDCDLSFTNPIENIEYIHTSENEERTFANPLRVSSKHKMLEENEDNSPVGSKFNTNSFMSKSITVYEDEVDTMPNIISCQRSRPNLVNINYKKHNETCVQDMPMEFTEVISNSLYPMTSASHQYDKCNMNENGFVQSETGMMYDLQNASMEMTQIVPATNNIFTTDMEMTCHGSPLVQNCHNTDADGTKHFTDNLVEFTECLGSLKNDAINKLLKTQSIEELNSNCVSISSGKQQISEANVQDTSMEFTMAIRSLLKPVCDASSMKTTKCFIEDDRTKVFQNTSMEMTAAVPVTNSITDIALHGVQLHQSRLVKEAHGNSDKLPCTTKDKTVLFNDMSMEITKAVKSRADSIHPGDDASQDKAFSVLTLKQRKSQTIDEFMHAQERTRLLDVSMEMTKPVSSNEPLVAKHTEWDVIGCEKGSNINFVKHVANGNETKICNNESMDFTAAVSTFPKKHSVASQNTLLVQNVLSSQPHLHNSDLSKDNTVHNVDLTLHKPNSFKDSLIKDTVVTQLPDVRDILKKGTGICNPNTASPELCNKSILFPNMSMEVTDAIAGLLGGPPGLNSVPNLNNSREQMLLQAPDNKTISVTSDSRLINTHPMLDKENCITNWCSKDSTRYRFSKRDTLNKTDKFANDEASMALHDVVEQDLSASALTGNNAQKADFTTVSQTTPLTTTNTVLSETSPTVMSDAQQDGDLKSIMLNTSATCNQLTIDTVSAQDPSTSVSVTNTNIALTSNTGGCKTQPVNNDSFHFKARNKKNCAHSTLKPIDNSQDAENSDTEHFMEKSVTFHNQTLEEIEFIEPPSFFSLDESERDKSAINNSCSHEVNKVVSPISDIRSNESTVHSSDHHQQSAKHIEPSTCDNVHNVTCSYQDYHLVRDHQMLDEEMIRKSHTFVIKQRTFHSDPDDSKLDCDNQMQIVDVQKLQLTCMNNTENRILDMSILTDSDTSEEIPEFDVRPSFQDTDVQELHADDTGIETERMACPSSAVTSSSEGGPISNVENNHKKNELSLHVQSDCHEEVEFHTIQNTSNENEIGNNMIDDKEVASSTVLSGSLDECVDTEERDTSADENLFSSLSKNLKIHAQSDDIIWDVCHENIERNMLVIGFMSRSLLVVIFLTDNSDATNTEFIKEIKLISRLADDEDTLIDIVHRLVLEKVDAKELMSLYKNYDDILPMLDHVSKEVILNMDFMFDVKRLDDPNLMEFTRDRISFVSFTNRTEIILKVTISVKPFDKIEPHDITVDCMLGSVREEDVKSLITNIKRDHIFLRRYINDVKKYIYLMEETRTVKKSY